MMAQGNETLELWPWFEASDRDSSEATERVNEGIVAIIGEETLGQVGDEVAKKSQGSSPKYWVSRLTRHFRRTLFITRFTKWI